MSKKTVHYESWEDYAWPNQRFSAWVIACGRETDSKTRDDRKVTCGGCRRTTLWKEDHARREMQRRDHKVHAGRITASVKMGWFPYCPRCKLWLTTKDRYKSGPWTQYHYLRSAAPQLCKEQITWVKKNPRGGRLKTPDPSEVLLTEEGGSECHAIDRHVTMKSTCRAHREHSEIEFPETRDHRARGGQRNLVSQRILESLDVGAVRIGHAAREAKRPEVGAGCRAAPAHARVTVALW